MIKTEPPRLALDRRSLLAGGLGGIGLAALPGAALGQAAGFTHGVASGEPAARQVLLWTRYLAPGDDAPMVRFEVSESEAFGKVIGGGEVRAERASDGCAKAVATGLEPGRWYFYRFVAPDGAFSPTGRTRTLPEGRTERFRAAVFSCANLPFGWFNAYAHAADAGDFDAVLHLGDYYYEYKRGVYPSLKQALAGRVLLPEHEAVLLADYRLRHADYRADPDLQRLFRMFPWIMVWDDHETANDSWRGGAENHDPASEETWEARKRAAVTAYREWLPVSDASWAAYEIGDLATLYRLETRLTARDEPFDLDTLTKGTPAQIDAALAAFRDGGWRDPRRTLLGSEQEAWLGAGLAASQRAGKPWQVLAQQIVMGELKLPAGIAAGMGADTPDYLRRRIANAVAASHVGLPFNMDAWDGYPAARERLLASARAADANLIVLAGDSHNAWANHLTSAGAPAGVELAGTSVTSPGAENSLYWLDPARLAADTVAANPGLTWCDTAHRGYLALELTPARATGEYRLLDTIRARSTRLAATRRLTTESGTNRFAA